MVTRSTIVNVELGRKKDLTITELMLISKALGISPLALMIDMDDLFTKESEYPGFEGVPRFQLMSWIRGSGRTFTPESLPGLAVSSIVEHYEAALRFTNEAEDVLEQARDLREHGGSLEIELAEKLEKRAESYLLVIDDELSGISNLTGKPIPGWVREALIMETQLDG